MKGLKISINVLLIVAMIAEIAAILLLVIGGREVVGDIVKSAAEGSEDPGGKAAGAFGGALVGVIIYALFLLAATVIFVALIFAVVSIIVFNKKGYAPLGFGIICLVFLPVGILMLIQRSKYLQNNMNNRNINDFA